MDDCEPNFEYEYEYEYEEEYEEEYEYEYEEEYEEEYGNEYDGREHFPAAHNYFRRHDSAVPPHNFASRSYVSRSVSFSSKRRNGK